MQPHAPELEEAVIGACLIEQEALPLIADKLRPEMFYDCLLYTSRVNLKTRLDIPSGKAFTDYRIVTELKAPDGKVVASDEQQGTKSVSYTHLPPY